MRKKPIFSLDPDQLERLLSVGTGDPDPIEEQEQQTGTNKVGMDREDTARGGHHPPCEKDLSANATASLAGMERPGSQIGRYKLLRVLGEGGMGMVYLAEQEGQIRRKVALKVIKPGMDSKRVIARFETERQALALLDHPGIAQVYDAGTTETGRPYFVMEHVRGLSITDYCDRHKLIVEDRLRLFQQVCLAVHHAHQKGIIHRDIKPSNILVSAENDRPIPKIIDFGVAKAISQPLTERTLFTEDNHLLGTPEYMSPEQADMSNEDIDTRSDIYSLGVLLYVLLAGILPYDSKTFRQGGVEHIRRIIRETDPKTPSTRLAKLGEKASKLAENRRTEIHTLAKHLKKELEWIPLRAMRKDRAERYRSASEFADDIENYLKGAPLLAGPLSTMYRLRKLVRRNRALVAGIAVVLIILIAGVVGIAIFAVKAERRGAEAQLIADFLENDVLGSVTEISVGEATISDMLDAASKKLEGKFKDKPLIEARICEKLGWMYWVLGEPTKGEPHLLNASRIYRQHHGEEHVRTLAAMSRLGSVYLMQGRYHDMERLHTKNLQIGQRVYGEKHPLGNPNGLAVAFYCLGRYKEAESLFDKILEIVRHEVGEENVPYFPYFRCNLAAVYWRQGRYKEAERLFVETLENAEWTEMFGKSWELQYAYPLGNVYIELGRYDKAETLFVKTLKTQRLARGDEHLHTLRTMYGLARLYTAQDRHEEAESLFTEMLEIGPRRLGEDHPVTLGFMNGFAVLLTKQKCYDKAEPLFKKALEGRRQKLDEDHPDTLESKHDLAVLYMRQARYEDAEPLLLEAFHGRETKLSPDHPHTVDSLRELVNLYESWDKPEEAAKWRATFTG